MRQRQATFELLRIISMMMVLLVHADGAALGLPHPDGNIVGMTGRDVWQLAVESFAIIGVNCFTMISGYFGIRLRLRSVVSFLFQCIFYSVGICLAVYAVKPELFSWTGLAESCMVLTHTDLWYVPAYFGLMLLSPLLNAGAELMPRRTFLGTVGGFTLFNIWCGWWWQGTFNPTGYTLVQLIMMYLIGRAVALYIPETGARRPAVLYVISFAAVFVSAMYMEPLRAFAYNSPAVMAATVSFFLIFRSMKFESHAVCTLAKPAFAVYLIHKAPPVWGGVVKPAVISLWHSLNLTEFSLAITAGIVALYLLCCCADAVRRFIYRKLTERIWP